MENNKNKKSVKFQGDMLNFYDFIQVFVFTTNHHLKHYISRRCGTGLAWDTSEIPSSASVGHVVFLQVLLFSFTSEE